MGWPVQWLKRMISGAEFDLWCRYFKHHPFDDESVHHAPLAMLTSIYVNAHQERGAQRTVASDFMIFRKPKPKPVDLDAKFRLFFASVKPDPA